MENFNVGDYYAILGAGDATDSEIELITNGNNKEDKQIKSNLSNIIDDQGANARN